MVRRATKNRLRGDLARKSLERVSPGCVQWSRAWFKERCICPASACVSSSSLTSMTTRHRSVRWMKRRSTLYHALPTRSRRAGGR